MDGAEDDTLDLVQDYAREHGARFSVLENRTRQYKSMSFQRGLELVPPDGIVAEMDLDDSLISPRAVEDLLRLHVKYDAVWTQHMTVNRTSRPWTTWRSTRLPWGWSRRTAEGDRVWSSKYFPGHMRTFKKYLFDAIDPELLRFRGEPLKVAFDMVYFTSILEMVPPSLICFYDQPVYRYNIWSHNDDFLEIDTVASLEAPPAELRQSEMDRWFKRLPLPAPLAVETQVHGSDGMTTVTRTVRCGQEERTLRYAFAPSAPGTLAGIMRYCIVPKSLEPAGITASPTPD